MIAVINELSFEYQFETKEHALNSIMKFIHICKKIKSDSITNIDKIIAGEVDKQIQIAPRYNLIKLIQEIKPREERTFFLSLLTNSGVYVGYTRNCIINGKSVKMVIYDKNELLISLEGNEIFCDNIISIELDNNEINIRNISRDEHIDFYRRELGIRKYVANKEKHKPDRENAYGKGKIGSRMDLADDEAQVLLNKAIEINGRLYAKKNGSYYAFQNEQDVIFHGYRADDLKENIVRILDRKFV